MSLRPSHTVLLALLSLAACSSTVESSPPAPDSGRTPDAESTHDAGVSAEAATTPPDGSCRSNDDCTMSSFCGGPITAASLCMTTNSCDVDAGCGIQGLVCSTGNQAQTPDGGPACRPPCTASFGCNSWESCDTSTGVCGALPCDACPSYLSCPSGGVCGPKACAADSQCPGGFCVDGTCFGTLGTCQGNCV